MAVITALVVSSCWREEDQGPQQRDNRSYSILDFDRLEVGEAMVVTVQQGPVYTVNARGDRRNLDDLDVSKVGSTLKIQYTTSRSRNYTTYIDITMPTLLGANFSGAVTATAAGFRDADAVEVIASGASVVQFNGESKKLTVNLSGASKLTASGKADSFIAKASGASEVNSYGLPALVVEAEASGASKLNVFASQQLNAVAAGASVIIYRGNPTVTSNVSGASTVRAD